MHMNRMKLAAVGALLAGYAAPSSVAGGRRVAVDETTPLRDGEVGKVKGVMLHEDSKVAVAFDRYQRDRRALVPKVQHAHTREMQRRLRQKERADAKAAKRASA